MTPIEICKGVKYVGVNDRSTHKFEALWPLPNGVSYNSYLVIGSEATALIDSVELATLPALMANLNAEGIPAPSYLVINHMEPDHSGSIPEILRAFPDLKIVGNRLTLEMVKGFYGFSDASRMLEIKDGETLSLGDRELKFILTPMVHWPETMMTWLEDEGVLFSGDAFGTFGALNGAVLDSDMDTALYFREMYRYYSNIVGKYGAAVQRAFAKLKDLPLKYICSTHGPVWHARLNEAVDIYNRLSRYEGEPGATIVYGSMYGHTGAMAERLARQLSLRGVRNIRIHNASESSLSDMLADAFRYDILVVGSPTYSMTLFPPVSAFVNAIETRELRNRAFATFGSHTWAAVVEKTAGRVLATSKLESVGHMEMKQSLEADLDAQCADLAEKLVQKAATLAK